MAVETSPATEVMQKVNAYEMFQQQEGIPVVRGFAVGDLRTVDVQPWARRGVLGTYVNLDGTGGTNDAYVLEIPPGKATEPCHQLFEEMIYVLDGAGSTQIWYDDNKKVSFEWQKGSLFATPLNATHRHFNGRGDKPARFLAVTNAPVVMNLFHNVDFVFNNDHAFQDRVGDDRYFRGEGEFRAVKPGRHQWETNFVADLTSFKLPEWKERGAGGTSTNVQFTLASSTMHAHISEFGVGTYKKAHRHDAGAHIICVTGYGYSLLWREGEDPVSTVRVDWKPGTLYAPPDGPTYHQHFNTAPVPSRYFVMSFGGARYFVSNARKASYQNMDKSVAEGGNQIEYEDEDPRILAQYERECSTGVTSRMRDIVGARVAAAV
jgi:gentisate 1,2-dioxygenase